jgi:hypothetical protein
MVLTAGSIDRKRKRLQESYVLIERLKKLRALNADPRLVGINPRLQKTGRNYINKS